MTTRAPYRVTQHQRHSKLLRQLPVYIGGSREQEKHTYKLIQGVGRVLFILMAQ